MYLVGCLIVRCLVNVRMNEGMRVFGLGNLVGYDKKVMKLF